ncbi:MAG: histidine phosphatase family protein [Devosia sp.]
MATTLHILRHGKVDSHRGDVPLAADAGVDIAKAAALIAVTVEPGEKISFFTTTTRRSKDTAAQVRAFLAERFGSTISIEPPREEWALRNPDLFLAGQRVEMVSTPEAMAVQLPEGTITPAQVDAVPFYHSFFSSKDRIGFWMQHANPPGEDTRAVARRVLHFCKSLSDAGGSNDRRIICVSHSPVMRALIANYVSDHDPGEPAWVEAVNVTIVPRETSFEFRGTVKTTTD